MLLFTEEAEYQDYDIEFGLEYCYKVKSLFDDGESNPTETICATVIDPAIYSELGVESATVNAGEQFSLGIPLNNPIEVAGFQFTLGDDPDILSIVDVTTTERTEGFMISFNELGDGSVIIVGFDVSGGWIDIGEGSILNMVYDVGSVLSETDVNLSMGDVYLGGTDADELPVYSSDGTVPVIPAGASPLIVDDGSIELDSEGEITVSLENEEAVYGFQFMLTDVPDLVTYVGISTTERTESWMVSAQENDDNIITVIGFA